MNFPVDKKPIINFDWMFHSFMCISCTTLRFENRCNDKIEFINVLYLFLTQVMIVSRYLLGSVSFKKKYYLLSEKMPLQVFGFVFLTLYFSFKWNLVSMLFACLMHFFNASQISILKSAHCKILRYCYSSNKI